jgi:FkbM family methyltransferase
VTLSSRLKILLGAARGKLNQHVLNPIGLNLANQREINHPAVGSFLAWLFHGEPRVTCIQVGANDGRQMDPLRWLRLDPNWHSWLLEPNPIVYRNLKYNTRKEPHTTCLPLALGDRPGRLPLHVVDPHLAPANLRRFLDVSLLSSLDLNSLLRSLQEYDQDENKVRTWIKSVEVPVVDWTQLLNDEVGATPDLVVVDAEGYDLKLLSSFPLERCRPTAILFEHHWMEETDMTKLHRHLKSHDYRLFCYEMDTVAVQNRRFENQYAGYPFNRPLPAT